MGGARVLLRRRIQSGSILDLAVIGLLLGVTSGCVGPGPRRRDWGEQAGVGVGRDHFVRSLLENALDPRFLIPAVGAGIFTIDDWDERTSDWAQDHRPLFGSESSAKSASDVLVGILGAEALATIFLIPEASREPEESGGPEGGGDGGDSTLSPRLKGALVELAAFGATTTVVEGLKESVDRRRPGSEFVESSFPSGHTSEAFSLSSLALRNLEAAGYSRRTRAWVEAGNTVAAGLTGWARIEAGKHFPSDVLAGAALGRFVTTFVHDLFMRESRGDEPILEFTLDRGRVLFGVALRF